MPCTEHSHAFGRSPSRPEEPTTPKSHKSTTSRKTTLERARQHVMLLTACLVYLTTALLALQISIVSISNLKWTEYKQVDDELRAHSSALRKEKIMYGRLDDLVSTRLRRNLMETYEECLVRGLKDAHNELVGLGFQYPDVREQIIEWTTKECDRLQYSPQVVNAKTTPQEAVITYWTNVSYRARQIAEETLGLVRKKLSWVFSRLRGSSQHEETSLPTDSATADEVMHTDEPILPERLLPPVPFGFALQCQPDQPCRLVYPGDSTMHNNQPLVSSGLLEKLWERRKELIAFGTTLDWFGGAVIKVCRAVHYLEIVFHFLCVLMYGPCIINIIIYKTLSPAGPKEETVYLAKSLMLEHFSAVLLSMLDRKPRLLSTNLTIPVAFVFASIGLNMILKLFIPGPHLESIVNMYMSLRDLYSIIRDHDTAEDEYAHKVANDNGKKKDEHDTEISSLGGEKAPGSLDLSHPSKPHHRLANPETTVQQDIEHARHIMRRARARQTADDRADMNKSLETDTESEGDDGDAFVHVTEDITQEVGGAYDLPAWLMI